MNVIFYYVLCGFLYWSEANQDNVSYNQNTQVHGQDGVTPSSGDFHGLKTLTASNQTSDRSLRQSDFGNFEDGGMDFAQDYYYDRSANLRGRTFPNQNQGEQNRIDDSLKERILGLPVTAETLRKESIQNVIPFVPDESSAEDSSPESDLELISDKYFPKHIKCNKKINKKLSRSCRQACKDSLAKTCKTHHCYKGMKKTMAKNCNTICKEDFEKNTVQKYCKDEGGDLKVYKKRYFPQSPFDQDDYLPELVPKEVRRYVFTNRT